jgi:hypothetical protein
VEIWEMGWGADVVGLADVSVHKNGRPKLGVRSIFHFIAESIRYEDPSFVHATHLISVIRL